MLSWEEVASCATLSKVSGAHVRFTCLDAFGDRVAMGANTGSMYLYRRANFQAVPGSGTETKEACAESRLHLIRIFYKQDGENLGFTPNFEGSLSSMYGKLVRQARPASVQEGDALVGVKLSPLGDMCATANKRGLVSIFSLGGKRDAPLKVTVIPEAHRGEVVTAIEWSCDGRSCFIGDGKGTVTVTTIKCASGSKNSASQHAEADVTSVTLKVAGPVVQLSACPDNDLVLVSTRASSFLLCLKTFVFSNVGSKPRDGAFGAVFHAAAAAAAPVPAPGTEFGEASSPNRWLLAARPGRRLWLVHAGEKAAHGVANVSAGKNNAVRATLRLASLPVAAAIPWTHKNTETSAAETSVGSVQFGRLLPLGPCLLSISDKGLCVVNFVCVTCPGWWPIRQAVPSGLVAGNFSVAVTEGVAFLLVQGASGVTVWQVSAPPSAVDLVHAYAAAALQQESSSLLEAIQLATRLQVVNNQLLTLATQACQDATQSKESEELQLAAARYQEMARLDNAAAEEAAMEAAVLQAAHQAAEAQEQQKREADVQEEFILEKEPSSIAHGSEHNSNQQTDEPSAPATRARAATTSVLSKMPSASHLDQHLSQPDAIQASPSPYRVKKSNSFSAQGAASQPLKTLQPGSGASPSGETDDSLALHWQGVYPTCAVSSNVDCRYKPKMRAASSAAGNVQPKLLESAMLGTPPVHPPERVFRAAMRLTTRPGVSLPEAEDEQADGAHSAPEDCGATPMAAGSLGNSDSADKLSPFPLQATDQEEDASLANAEFQTSVSVYENVNDCSVKREADASARQETQDPDQHVPTDAQQEEEAGTVAEEDTTSESGSGMTESETGSETDAYSSSLPCLGCEFRHWRYYQHAASQEEPHGALMPLPAGGSDDSDRKDKEEVRQKLHRRSRRAFRALKEARRTLDPTLLVPLLVNWADAYAHWTLVCNTFMDHVQSQTHEEAKLCLPTATSQATPKKSRKKNSPVAVHAEAAKKQEAARCDRRDGALAAAFVELGLGTPPVVPASRADTPSAALVRPRSTVAIVQSRGGLSDRSARHQLDENKNSNMKHLPWSERKTHFEDLLVQLFTHEFGPLAQQPSALAMPNGSGSGSSCNLFPGEPPTSRNRPIGDKGVGWGDSGVGEEAIHLASATMHLIKYGAELMSSKEAASSLLRTIDQFNVQVTGEAKRRLSFACVHVGQLLVQLHEKEACLGSLAADILEPLDTHLWRWSSSRLRFEPALSELLDAKDHNLVAHAHEDHDLVADESAIGLEGHAQGKRAEEQPESGICMDSCQGTCARCQMSVFSASSQTMMFPCGHAFHRTCLPEEACVKCMMENSGTLPTLWDLNSSQPSFAQ